MEVLQGYYHLSLMFERILGILKAVVVLNDTEMVDNIPTSHPRQIHRSCLTTLSGGPMRPPQHAPGPPVCAHMDFLEV